MPQHDEPIANLVGIDDIAWQKDQGCKDKDPEIFFSESQAKVNEAKRTCWMQCPVRLKCFEWILRIESQQGASPGTYGGYSRNQRERKVRMCKYKPCGKIYRREGYNAWCSPECQKLYVRDQQASYYHDIYQRELREEKRKNGKQDEGYEGSQDFEAVPG